MQLSNIQMPSSVLFRVTENMNSFYLSSDSKSELNTHLCNLSAAGSLPASTQSYKVILKWMGGG